jgi:hypothetical protein
MAAFHRRSAAAGSRNCRILRSLRAWQVRADCDAVGKPVQLLPQQRDAAIAASRACRPMRV